MNSFLMKLKHYAILCSYAHMATSDKGLTTFDGYRPHLWLHGFGKFGRDLEDFSIQFSGSTRYQHHHLSNANYALNLVENEEDALKIHVESMHRH